jgi:hypothetical protein
VNIIDDPGDNRTYRWAIDAQNLGGRDTLSQDDDFFSNTRADCVNRKERIVYVLAVG